ncbi:transposase [Achromobacter xylosoxidans]
MIKIKRRAFTAEFKLEAVRMVTDKGLGVPEVCASLGLGETALRRWLVQYKADVLGKPALDCRSRPSSDASASWSWSYGKPSWTTSY